MFIFNDFFLIFPPLNLIFISVIYLKHLRIENSFE